MLEDFYIPRLSNVMKIVVQKNHLDGQILLYRFCCTEVWTLLKITSMRILSIIVLPLVFSEDRSDCHALRNALFPNATNNCHPRLGSCGPGWNCVIYEETCRSYNCDRDCEKFESLESTVIQLPNGSSGYVCAVKNEPTLSYPETSIENTSETSTENTRETTTKSSPEHSSETSTETSTKSTTENTRKSVTISSTNQSGESSTGNPTESSIKNLTENPIHSSTENSTSIPSTFKNSTENPSGAKTHIIPYIFELNICIDSDCTEVSVSFFQIYINIF